MNRQTREFLDDSEEKELAKFKISLSLKPLKKKKIFSHNQDLKHRQEKIHQEIPAEGHSSIINTDISILL